MKPADEEYHAKTLTVGDILEKMKGLDPAMPVLVEGDCYGCWISIGDITIEDGTVYILEAEE